MKMEGIKYRNLDLIIMSKKWEERIGWIVGTDVRCRSWNLFGASL